MPILDWPSAYNYNVGRCFHSCNIGIALLGLLLWGVELSWLQPNQVNTWAKCSCATESPQRLRGAKTLFWTLENPPHDLHIGLKLCFGPRKPLTPGPRWRTLQLFRLKNHTCVLTFSRLGHCYSGMAVLDTILFACSTVGCEWNPRGSSLPRNQTCARQSFALYSFRETAARFSQIHVAQTGCRSANLP